MDNIYLRSFTDDDIPLLAGWLKTPHVERWYDHPEDWLAEAAQREGKFSFIMHKIAMLNDFPVGFCQYYDCYFTQEEEFPAPEPGKVYSIDYLIGEERYLRKGYCKQMTALMLAEIGPGKAVMTQPDSENAASCNTLLSCGFRFNEKLQVYVKVQ